MDWIYATGFPDEMLQYHQNHKTFSTKKLEFEFFPYVCDMSVFLVCIWRYVRFDLMYFVTLSHMSSLDEPPWLRNYQVIPFPWPIGFLLSRYHDDGFAVKYGFAVRMGFDITTYPTSNDHATNNHRQGKDCSNKPFDDKNGNLHFKNAC